MKNDLDVRGLSYQENIQIGQAMNLAHERILTKIKGGTVMDNNQFEERFLELSERYFHYIEQVKNRVAQQKQEAKNKGQQVFEKNNNQKKFEMNV